MFELDREEAIRLLIVNARNLFNAALGFNRSPVNEALYQLLKNPRPGDMVLEWTGSNAGHTGIGTLLKVTREPVDNWDVEANDGEPAPLDTYTYIRDVDGNEQRWYNCDFIRVLTEKTDTISEAIDRGLYRRY